MDSFEINAEIITAILSIFGGVIIIIFKLMGIPLSQLNVFKKTKDENEFKGKSKILEDMENLLQNESSKYISKIGRVIQFCEIVKPQQSDFFDQYLKLWVAISKHSNVAYRKLTLDCTRLKLYNSTFLAALSGLILQVKKENGIKLMVLVDKNSSLYDLVGHFEMIKEDSTSVEIKAIKDYRE